MTKEEFIEGYAKRSNRTVDEILKVEIALPCSCDYEECNGWAMVSNNPESIKIHNELYA